LVSLPVHATAPSPSGLASQRRCRRARPRGLAAPRAALRTVVAAAAAIFARVDSHRRVDEAAPSPRGLASPGPALPDRSRASRHARGIVPGECESTDVRIPDNKITTTSGSTVMTCESNLLGRFYCASRDIDANRRKTSSRARSRGVSRTIAAALRNRRVRARFVQRDAIQSAEIRGCKTDSRRRGEHARWNGRR
jgi:hypothetical protein